MSTINKLAEGNSWDQKSMNKRGTLENTYLQA